MITLPLPQERFRLWLHPYAYTLWTIPMGLVQINVATFILGKQSDIKPKPPIQKCMQISIIVVLRAVVASTITVVNRIFTIVVFCAKTAGTPSFYADYPKNRAVGA
jgi:hypothetical protein